MKILVAAALTQEAIDRLREAVGEQELTYRPCNRAEELTAHFDPKTEVLLTRILPDLTITPNLKWIQTFGAGVDHILSHPLCQPPVKVTTSSGIHAEQMAELVFAFILYFQRSLGKMQTYCKLRKWPKPFELNHFFERSSLRNQTLGIAGFGAIGQAVGRIGNAFGMNILAFRRHRGKSSSLRLHTSTGTSFSFQEMYDLEGLRKLAAVSDYMAICLPLTKETNHLINDDVLRQMKPTSILINVGRGAVVDEQALLGVLRTKRIAGAALDVYEREPLPTNHPFYSMDNVFLSPHVGGTRADYDMMVVEVFAENLARYLSGQPLLNEVNWTLQY